MNRARRDRGGVLKVLLIILGAFLLIVVCVGVYVGLHWKGWAADAANMAAQSVVDQSGLPQDQKNSILAEIRRIGNDFREGRMSTQDLARVTKAIGESPLIPLAGVQAARHRYIEPSDMTEKEKADAILTVQRFGRGVYEKKIRKEEIDDIIKPITELRQNGRWQLKDHPTRMELDQFLENAKARADAEKIPMEPFDLNIAEELKKALNEGRS